MQACRPSLDALLIGDQVLPHLDQHMRQPVHRAVPVERVVLQLSRIGLVVAHDDVGLAPQPFKQRQRHAPVSIPQDPEMPRPLLTAPVRGEAVDRDEDRHDPLCHRPLDRCSDRFVIGRMKPPDAFLDTAPVEVRDWRE